MDELLIYRELGRAVATRRKMVGLTQAEVAKVVGISRASIANIEAGRQKVLLHQVYGLVKALDLKAITELVPAAAPRAAAEATADRLTTWGAPVSDAQMSGVEQLLKSALDQRQSGSTR
ncbi:MAG: helix-turn-helix domain-containing protein [Sphingomonadaceae bacterium]|nr:helix-turn-helix domain-containing protein [Sphingomonadaceae bacterium]